MTKNIGNNHIFKLVRRHLVNKDLASRAPVLRLRRDMNSKSLKWVIHQYLHNLIFHFRLDWPLCPFICPQTLRWIRVSHEYFLISDCHSRYLSKSGLDWNSQSSVSKDFSAIVLFMIVVITKTLVGCYKDPKIFYRPSYLSLPE